MVNLARLPKSPRCLFCLQRIANADISDLVVPFRRQLRGAKKGKAPSMLNVRLLEDIRGYGSKGSVIPVAPGRMRNIFYPRRVAAYVSEEQLRDLRAREVPIQRDFTFGMEKPTVEGSAEKTNVGDSTNKPSLYTEPGKDLVVDVQMDLVAPRDASEIISSSLPKVLQFYRIPIPNPQREMSHDESRTTQSWEHSSDSDLTADLVLRVQGMPIFGSVSTADIAEQVKAVLRETKEGARVVLGADDIKILNDEGEEANKEADRLKMLGDFPVEIRVKSGDAVRRTVRILAREGS